MSDQPDSRNLTDDLKGRDIDDIIDTLDARGIQLHIALENLVRDFNMGSIVRTANAVGVRHVHIIGRKQWNKRGAMATDKYLHVHHYDTVSDFLNEMHRVGIEIIAVDNTDGSIDITKAVLPPNCVLIFGSEADGLSSELLRHSDQIVHIRQRGSTRSMNVGAAAAIAMYEWTRRNV